MRFVIMGIKKKFKKTIFYDWLSPFFYKLLEKKCVRKGDALITKEKWKKRFGYNLDLENPRTLNEKIQWLKLNDRKDIYNIWADKYCCREYIKQTFGEQYLVPLLFVTDNPSQINEKNIKDFPCVIKANHTSGDYFLFRNGNKVNWFRVRTKCKRWLRCNYYHISQEWQYSSMKRYILVERMLLDKQGKIPNDYKLHFIEGQLAFVYCSIDREGDNYRQIYSPDWKLLNFSWDGNGMPLQQTKPITKPATFQKMCEFGKIIAKNMHYVRVDFYDVDGVLYFGEITLYHGGGFDKFVPNEYDLFYGEMIKL